MIAASVGGLRNLVHDGVDGFLVPGANPPALADKIRLLAASADLRGAFGNAGRALAAESYSWEKIADETERIYRGAEARSAKLPQKRAPVLIATTAD